ncbi:hypothetical protein AVEN_235417-1 [Araneus ventricosus]|uniref:Uncharacterized protein n=1 Tax=Araneus ventricosus TaxID=182803 RepID=A0A4Y2A6C6_ARAVE|nr:hypothetical protein AVEN_235417-1 [Araneus ventricosus]
MAFRTLSINERQFKQSSDVTIVKASDIWQKTALPIGLLAEAVLVTIPLKSADHLRWSASIVLCTTNSTEQGFLPITTHPTAAAPAIWER